MREQGPLVTIGIPTFNRAQFLKLSIESALNQGYKNVEVIVSDNASTDATESVCRAYAAADPRLKYFKHAENVPMAVNFGNVLKNTSGRFFMWLGDDDWIDPHYVATALEVLERDPTVSVVSGTPRYYRQGKKIRDGKSFTLLHRSWRHRVLAFYWHVTDNGHLYGLMRTTQILQVPLRVTMGADWLIVARMAAFGKIIMLDEISVHRELGGASTSYWHIMKSCGLPILQGIFPATSIVTSAAAEIIFRDSSYRNFFGG